MKDSVKLLAILAAMSLVLGFVGAVLWLLVVIGGLLFISWLLE